MDIEVIIADTNIKMTVITPGTKGKNTFKFRIVIQLGLGLYLIGWQVCFVYFLCGFAE
jgi:RecA-family ATPase